MGSSWGSFGESWDLTGWRAPCLGRPRVRRRVRVARMASEVDGEAAKPAATEGDPGEPALPFYLQPVKWALDSIEPWKMISVVLIVLKLLSTSLFLGSFSAGFAILSMSLFTSFVWYHVFVVMGGGDRGSIYEGT